MNEDNRRISLKKGFERATQHVSESPAWLQAIHRRNDELERYRAGESDAEAAVEAAEPSPHPREG